MPHIVDQSPTFAGNISAAEHLISLDELLDCWLVEFSIQTLSWAVPVWWTILNARTAQLGLAAYEEPLGGSQMKTIHSWLRSPAPVTIG